MHSDNVLGTKVKYFRDKLDLTQDALAEASSLTQGEISKIEKGNIKAVKPETITKLAAGLRVQPEILARGTVFAHFFNTNPQTVAAENDQRPPVLSYFASALTNLTAKQLKKVAQIDDIIDEVCSGYATYPVALYRPRLHTAPLDTPKLPSPEVYAIDRERVATCDLLFLATIYPSLGAGMELQLALQSCTSVIFLTEPGVNVSKMVLGCPVRYEIVEYQSSVAFKTGVIAAMDRILPVIADIGLSAYDNDSDRNSIAVGRRVKDLREQRHLSREALADLVGLHSSYIADLESLPDRITNPSFEILLRLAKALWTSPAYLISGQQGIDPRFVEHQDELRIFANEVDMSYRDFELLWTSHVDSYRGDFAVANAKNRTEVVDRKYWKQKYEEHKEGGPRLF